MKLLTTEKFIERAIAKHGNKYSYKNSIYSNAKTKMEIVCSKHGSFYQTPYEHLHYGCAKCGIDSQKNNIRTKLASTFIEKATKTHGTKYDYSNVKYLNTKIKIEIICSIHGSFFQRSDIHISGQGCPKCGIEKNSKARKSNVNDFIMKAKAIHGEKYNYSRAIYLNAKTKMEIICPTHGSFWQNGNNHISGMGCQKCGYRSISDFIEKCNIIHNNKYDYSLIPLTFNSKTKIEIICPTHSSFFINAGRHLYSKNGCQICGNIMTGNKLRSSIEEFIEKAKSIHGNKYNYSKTFYGKNSNEKIEIECLKHGIFKQSPMGHLSGYGCKQCGRYKSQDLWLDSMGLPNDHEHRQVNIILQNGKKIVADGFDPVTNTVYEYWGTYFHGHPDYYNSNDVAFTGKTFGELYLKTLNKIDNIRTSGYNLVEQWAHHLKNGEVILLNDSNINPQKQFIKNNLSKVYITGTQT